MVSWANVSARSRPEILAGSESSPASGGPHLPRLRHGPLPSPRERDLSGLRVAPLSLWEVRVSPPAPKAGLACAIRGSHRRPQQSHGAAGAVALRLELKRLRNGALPPAAPDRAFGGTPSWGPMVPGLRYRLRRKSNRTAIARSRPKRKRRALDEACLGKSCHWHDFCSSTALPAFAGPPWPDLPRARRDRLSPARPILSLPSRPERYLIRLPEGQAWSIAQEAVRRIGKGRSLLPKGRHPRWPQAIRGSISGRCGGVGGGEWERAPRNCV